MESKSIFPQAVKTGLIAIGLSIVLTLLAYVTGMNMFGWVFQVISYAVLLGVMVWGVLSYRKANGGFMSFGQGFGIIIVAGLVCSFISYFFNLVYANYINPDYMAQTIEASSAMVQKIGGTMTDEMEQSIMQGIEESMRFSLKKMTLGLIGSLIIWSILGAIISGILSRKNPQEEI